VHRFRVPKTEWEIEFISVMETDQLLLCSYCRQWLYDCWCDWQLYFQELEMSKDDEQVLCVKRCHVEDIFGIAPLREGLITAPPASMGKLLRFATHVRRGDCESDPEYKQLIPYIVVRSSGFILRYHRMKGTGEARLAGKASIGIGGHINLTDELEAKRMGISQIMAAARRELIEEIHCGDQFPEFSYIGYINNEDDPVGQVHLGVLLEWSGWRRGMTLPPEVPAPNDEDIGNLAFSPVWELKGNRHHFERWSQIVIDYMSGESEEITGAPYRRTPSPHDIPSGP
jgi:predicted NUDIX family phosphoesterase